MPSADRRSRRPSLTTAVALFTALAATLLPLTHVVSVGPWVAGALVVMGLVLAVGHLARRLALSAVVASVLETAVWYLFTMLVFLAGTAFVGVIPTGATLDAISGFAQTAGQEIALGVAPLPATAALSFCFVALFGALAVVMDHVVVTTRMPLLAAVALVTVWLIPSVVVPGGFDVVGFVLLAASILLLLRAETRSRGAARRSRTGGVVAVAIGSVAIVVALVVTPLLPTPAPRTDLGAGGSALAINADLDLGRDLRQPRSTEVLTLRTTLAPRVPYLRVATLSTLSGDVWQPDAGPTARLQPDDAFAPLETAPGIEVTESETQIQVSGLSSPWLPIPYAAVGVTGLSGNWNAADQNRTIVADGTTTANQAYTVVAEQPKPTLEQIRGRPALGSGDDPRYTALPDGMPSSISELARQVTADASNDYDRLAALQRWFRGPDFTYSLEAPVAEGFDGSGVDAVARFLEVRKGYCVHFASAFALMARSLGMPTRIVVGYLPGTSVGQLVDDQRVFSVSSSQLHAWPEVFFSGIGWVGFDPTKGLGQPTSFSPSSLSTTGGTDDPADQETADEPGDEPSPTPSSSAGHDVQDSGGGVASGPASGGTALPAAAIGVAVLLALCIPSVAGALRRRRQRVSARHGRADAAWALVQDTAIDLGIEVPASESPRAFGARLASVHGVPPPAIDALVSAIERASYAPAPGRRGAGPSLVPEADAVRSAVLASAHPVRRVLAAAFPRSLVIRPGSAFAASGHPANAG